MVMNLKEFRETFILGLGVTTQGRSMSRRMVEDERTAYGPRKENSLVEGCTHRLQADAPENVGSA